MVEKSKAASAIEALSYALTFEEKLGGDPFFALGIAKAFEVALEYCWKHFQREAVNAGLDVFSPRDAIKQAGRMGLIDNVEQWLSFLRVRNIAAHDYLGISPEDHLRIIKEFHLAALKLGLK